MSPTIPFALALLALAAAHPARPLQEPAPTWTGAELERVAAEVQADIERIRGERFERPTQVRVASRETLEAYIRERTALHETPERRAGGEAIAKLLGALPAEADLEAITMRMLAGQVAGFYDPPTKTFYLMDSLPRGLGRVTMAHELVHALDDQLFDIDGGLKARERNSDGLLAYQAVVEGSGMVGMSRWIAANPGAFDASELLALQAEQSASMAGAPEWLWKPLLGAYLQGSAFLTRGNGMSAATGSVATGDIHAAFRDPPRSSEQILHPEKHWDPEHRDEPREVGLAVGPLPAGWRVLHEDTLGELLVAIVTDPLREPADLSNPLAALAMRFTHPVAEGWGGDRIVLLEREGALFLHWATAWDTPRDAAEFYGCMRTLLPRLQESAKAVAAVPGLRGTGADVRYGEADDVVLVEVHAGVRGRDLRALQAAVEASVGSR